MTHSFQLVAIRHGQTAWNAGGRFQGQTDVPLDERGRAQGRALGAALANERFDLVVVSDLTRARETAELIVAGRDLNIQEDPRWREMRFGMWEGLTWPEIVLREPALAQGSPAAAKRYTPSGGESFDELCARVAAALAAIDGTARDGDNILVATHAGPLHALLRVALGESEAEALGVRFSPASVTRLALGPLQNRIVALNVSLSGEPFEEAS